MPEITETKLKEQIAKEQIGSLYFLYGDEKLLVRRNLNRLLKKLDGNFPEFNFQEFPHDAPVDSIADAVVAMPFMAERKCVTVSDLNVEAMNTAELDKLYELLDTIPETTVLILYLPTLEIDPSLKNTSAARPKRQTACSPASLPSASCSTSATT